jgi:tRNA-dihydrouridine synthase
MGYEEININLGCPSGTVTAKGKGAGMLEHPIDLELFLDEVFSKTKVHVSLKTRIGFSSPNEFEHLLEIFNRYPVHELIIHPRTRSQMYHGEPYRECYAAAEAYPHPVAYNGDLFTAADCRALMAEFPFTHAVMLGRGLIANPALAQELAGGDTLTANALRTFHDKLLAAYQQRYPANVVLGRMREVMKHVSCCFEDAHKPRKLIRKAATVEAYAAAADMMLSLPLRDGPGFDPYLYK